MLASFHGEGWVGWLRYCVGDAVCYSGEGVCLGEDHPPSYYSYDDDDDCYCFFWCEGSSECEAAFFSFDYSFGADFVLYCGWVHAVFEELFHDCEVG